MAYRRNEVAGRSRRVVGALLLALVAMLGVTLAAVPLNASAVTPVASEPQDRQRLSDRPGAVTLAFSREVDPSVAKVVVIGPGGDNVTSGPLKVEGTNVTTLLRDGLDKGTYTVHYRIDRSDGEPEGGAYQFSYGGGSFTDLPDRSWSGEDKEPAVLSGTNPNTTDAPDPPSSASQTPGIEVTSQAATSAPPPPTDPPSTVKAPSGTATEAASAPDSSASSAPTSGGSGTPWIIGGVLLLAAVAGLGIGVYRNRKGSGEHA